MTGSKKSNSDKNTSGKLIDLREIYKYEPDDIEIDIVNETYSNLAYIQIANRDMHIDFLKMPGSKEDGIQKVKGTRIYMSHAAAQKLANKLLEILDKSYSETPFEEYE